MEKVKLVIWKDETYKVCSQADAGYYQNDPNWLMTLDLAYLTNSKIKTGAQLIMDERYEQIHKHHYTPEHDADGSHSKGQLLQYAIFCITLNEEDYPKNWFHKFADKIIAKQENLIERYKIAGALIAAEIDRLQADIPESWIE